MPSFDRENRHNRYVPPRIDEYDFVPFTPEESPGLVLLAKQIQAQSYLNSHFVSPEGLVSIAKDVTVLSSDIGQLVELPDETAHHKVEYTIAVKNDTHDMDPSTGAMAAWRKYYAPLDELPAYQFCKNQLYESGELYLRYIDESPEYQLVEIEALSRTESARPRAIFELIRDRLTEARYKGEIWYFSIVEKTYTTFVQNWGPTAIMRVGGPQNLDRPNVNDVILIPAVLDVDRFLENIATDTLALDNQYAAEQFASFLFFSEGMTDAELGDQLVQFREEAPGILQNKNGVHDGI